MEFENEGENALLITRYENIIHSLKTQNHKLARNLVLITIFGYFPLNLKFYLEPVANFTSKDAVKNETVEER